MRSGPDIAVIAALLGDPGRANMLVALLDGPALTAGELAREAGITAQTASAHLARLEETGLVVRRRQGRHSYFRLAAAEVGAVLEALMSLSARAGARRTRPGPRDQALRQARACYDHLAGEAGVALYEALVDRGLVAAKDGDLTITPAGAEFSRKFGIDPDVLGRARRPIAKACLDWSERTSHLAGALGAALLTRMLELDWLRRRPGTRALVFTAAGRASFADLLGGGAQA
ncbi:MAG TPA: winged helix-turn-helix domain-containing protein [Caulobacteraceae bacterium]|nr:winged helix-turn-helix domain-containing protein [Caulobacteraceae bacterium]